MPGTPVYSIPHRKLRIDGVSTDFRGPGRATAAHEACADATLWAVRHAQPVRARGELGTDAAYDAVVEHILHMSDATSAGVTTHFP